MTQRCMPTILIALLTAGLGAVVGLRVSQRDRSQLQEQIIALKAEKLDRLRVERLAEVMPELEQRLRDPAGVMKLMLTGLIYERDPGVWKRRIQGTDWPETGLTMIGLDRLDNLQHCVETVIEAGVPGDLIEAGAWRGGATIFMRFLLEQQHDSARTVWVADSFEGLPPPDPERFPADADYDLSGADQLAVSVEQVQANFARFGLLDDRVRFLKGWFKDTLPDAPIERLSVLRIDADLYESTLQALAYLYPRLSVGGFVIIDDWGMVPPCMEATQDYRRVCGITEPVLDIDGAGVYWRKEREGGLPADEVLKALTRP